MTKNEIEILLVEDNATDVELTMRALRHDKLDGCVQVVRDGEEALDCLFCRGAYSARRFDQPPSLVLLDLKLPKLAGQEVLREVKSDPRTKAIPVVVMTSSVEEKDLAQSYRLGVNSYVQKSVDFRLFEERVKQLELYWLHVNEAPPPGAFLME
ncbi:MAG: two-component system response regulator [Acidobacteria bacterium]|nr:MAG: two-component system response regulator [Acidobacteriota bacterium]